MILSRYTNSYLSTRKFAILYKHCSPLPLSSPTHLLSRTCPLLGGQIPGWHNYHRQITGGPPYPPALLWSLNWLRREAVIKISIDKKKWFWDNFFKSVHLCRRVPCSSRCHRLTDWSVSRPSRGHSPTVGGAFPPPATWGVVPCSVEWCHSLPRTQTVSPLPFLDQPLPLRGPADGGVCEETPINTWTRNGKSHTGSFNCYNCQ